VPGSGTTDAALCATAYYGQLWLFAKGINDKIYGNPLVGGSWGRWWPVPGGGTTDAGLASAAGVDGRLYLFAKGINDRRIYMNIFDQATAWSGWQEVPGGGTTDAALRVCRYGARLVLFGKGIDDKKIYVNTMDPAGAWSGWVGLPGNVTAFTSITPAEGPDGLLYAFAVTPRQQIVYTTNANV
jgi:hypothetical protein